MTEFKVLAGVNPDDRELVLRSAVRRRYRKGEALFREGDRGDSFHLVVSGRVAVRVSTPDGNVATLNVIGPGGSFGELALVTSDLTRSATVEALEPTETLALQRTAFDDLCRQHPSVQGVLVGVLATQVRRLSNAVVEALYLPAELRVLRRLYEVSALYDEGTVPVVVPITQEELATMAGTTRPTVNKALQLVAAEGVVEPARGRIDVRDPAELARRAGVAPRDGTRP